MKSAVKKIMSVLIVAAMVITFIPILGTQTASAMGLIDPNAQGTTGNCKWSVEGTGAGNPVTLFITATSNDGRMSDYVYSSGDSNAPWLKYRDQIEAVEFKNVVYIGKYALYGCEKIRELEIDGVSRIGESAFYACRGLESIHINGVDCVIEDEAFDECFSNGIKMNAVELNGVKSLGNQAFGAVESYDLKLGEGLESIGKRCFFDNETLIGVTIPRSCKSIGEEAFAECKKMEFAIILNPSCTIGKDAFEKGPILGLKDSTAKTYADNNGLQFYAIGDVGSGEIDLTSGAADLDVDKFYGNDSTIEQTIEALVEYGLVAGKKEKIDTSTFYSIDADEDGSYDFVHEWKESVIHPVTVLPGCSVGGEITFNLSQDAIQASAEKGRPVYSTLIVRLPKLKNPMTVGAKTAAVKYSKLKKKNQILTVSKVLKIKNAKGTIRFKKLKGNSKITVNTATGKVTVKKGLKKGKYNIKVKVTDSGNDSYKEGAKTVTFRIWVK